MKVRVRHKRERKILEILCPACLTFHEIEIKKPESLVWNGDPDFPYLNHSIRIEEIRGNGPYVCHFSLIDGKIFYHKDSLHSLSGSYAELPDISPQIKAA